MYIQFSSQKRYRHLYLWATYSLANGDITAMTKFQRKLDGLEKSWGHRATRERRNVIANSSQLVAQQNVITGPERSGAHIVVVEYIPT